MACDHPNFELQLPDESDSSQLYLHQEIGSNHIVPVKQPRTDENTESINPTTSSCNNYSRSIYDIGQNGIIEDTSAEESSHSNNKPAVIDHEMEKYASYSDLLRDLGQESKMVVLQYSQLLGDSEVYEQEGAQAIADLTAHAEFLLQSLSKRKEALCDHLQSICGILKHEV